MSVHFSRFRVTQISLDDQGLDQFAIEPMLAASELLADARMDVITWNGTAAGWMGLEMDRALVAAIGERTGIAASTCVLSLVEALKELGAGRIGLVSPYTHDVQTRIMGRFATLGLPITAEAHFGLRDNFRSATYPGNELKAQSMMWRRQNRMQSSYFAPISTALQSRHRRNGGLASRS